VLLARRSVEADFDNMEGGDLAAAAGAEEEKYSWVPVRVARLTNLLHHLSAVQQLRWLDRRWERGWVARASAAEMGDADADAEERQLKLARDLCDVMSTSWYGFACALHGMAENVAEAVDPGGALRPRPESAAWWRFWYNDDLLPGSHGFVHLTRGQAARARGLLADALARTHRIRAPLDDLRRQCWPGAGAAAAFSTPALLARMRLADAVLLPLQELKRLVDHLIEVNNNNLRGRGGRERRRRRSTPPSRRTPAREPLLRRSASMSSLMLASTSS